ncbi:MULTISPECIES: MATE family efflux transporter [unclassified Gemella]|uniref:MATE family efflux transporter n=1 Tax=unclassified Gemella TaxID=2624949 RepID=UPI001C040357|nr:MULTISPECIES: MATE family efflux transporter [unclassified Gemella]MBU0278113.1 MATE family efflux transporter [Gemella sp. zg-1178]QWQ38362.1 MATE family efflux transporter [Gemella sp. zg-570]
MDNKNPLGYKSVGKLLKSMAIPAIIANVTNALYTIVDQIFIGQGVGYLANAATNISFPITTICLSIGVMVGIGTAANFNLYLGKEDRNSAEKVVGTSALLIIILGILIAFLVRIFLEPLMIIFGATPEILPYAMEFTKITTLGIPFYLFALGTNPLVRADRSPKYSMFAVMAGAIINLILNPIFIFVFKWGLAGSAWATVISQIISAIILVLYYKNFKSIKIKKENFKIKFSIVKSILSLGSASFIFQISTTIVQITTNNVLKIYGSESIYGSDTTIAIAGIVTKINTIFIAIVLGIVQGSQPIVSFNYGAKNYLRVRSVFKLVIKYSFAISLFLFLIFQIFPKEIISIFGQGSELYFEYGILYLRYYTFFIFINCIQIASTTFFPSIGKSKKGAAISLSKQLLVLFPLLIILPKFFGVKGVAYAVPISDLIAFAIATTVIYFEFKNMPKVDKI